MSGSWNEVLPRSAIGNQSPLYFYGLRLITQLFGAGELSLRIPSFLAGLGLVGVIGVAAWWLTRSTWVGLFAAFLVAVDRNCIFYSQEARPYAILQWIAWIHACIGWQLVKQPSRTLRLAFILGAILQFYLHYTAALFVGAELVLLMAIGARGGTYRCGSMLIDAAVIATACLPTTWQLLEIGARKQLWEQFVFQSDFADFVRILRLDVYGLLPGLALAAAWILSQGKISARAKGECHEIPDALLSSLGAVIGLLLFPSLTAWGATRWHVAALFLGRYLVSSLVAAPLATALTMRWIPFPRLRLFVAAGVAATSLANSGMVPQWQRDGRLLGDRNQDWRGAIAFINREARKDHAICFVRSGFIEADRLRTDSDPRLVQYCLAPVTSLYRLQIPAVPLPSSLEGANRDSLAQDIGAELRRDPMRDVWLVFNGSQRTRQRVLAILHECLPDRTPAITFKRPREFGDVMVCQFERE